MAMERWRPFGTVDRWEPFRNLVDIQGEVNRLFDAFAGRPLTGAPAAFRMSSRSSQMAYLLKFPPWPWFARPKL